MTYQKKLPKRKCISALVFVKKNTKKKLDQLLYFFPNEKKMNLYPKIFELGIDFLLKEVNKSMNLQNKFFSSNKRKTKTTHLQ